MSSLESLLTANKRANRLSPQPQDLSTRSFYHLAAALAHCESDSLACSQLLESDYQDCLLSFNALGQRLDTRKAKTHMINALNKLLVLQKNTSLAHLTLKPPSYIKYLSLLEQPEHAIIHAGVSFTPPEVASLLLWASGPWQEAFKKSLAQKHLRGPQNTSEFHHDLTTMAQRAGQRPFWFCGQIDNRPVDMLILKVNLYSANRLNKKSWQVDNGAQPGIRYYHAALHSESHVEPLDVLYWLKFDESHQIIAGEFIHRAVPKKLLCPLTDFQQWTNRQSGAESELSKKILSMYISSLGVQ